MPEVRPPDVAIRSASTNRTPRFAGISGNSFSKRSTNSWWVVAVWPTRSPARASWNAPVQTDIVMSAERLASRSQSCKAGPPLCAPTTMTFGCGAPAKVKDGTTFIPPVHVTGSRLSASVNRRNGRSSGPESITSSNASHGPAKSMTVAPSDSGNATRILPLAGSGRRPISMGSSGPRYDNSAQLTKEVANVQDQAVRRMRDAAGGETLEGPRSERVAETLARDLEHGGGRPARPRLHEAVRHPGRDDPARGPHDPDWARLPGGTRRRLAGDRRQNQDFRGADLCDPDLVGRSVEPDAAGHRAPRLARRGVHRERAQRALQQGRRRRDHRERGRRARDARVDHDGPDVHGLHAAARVRGVLGRRGRQSAQPGPRTAASQPGDSPHGEEHGAQPRVLRAAPEPAPARDRAGGGGGRSLALGSRGPLGLFGLAKIAAPAGFLRRRVRNREGAAFIAAVLLVRVVECFQERFLLVRRVLIDLRCGQIRDALVGHFSTSGNSCWRRAS